MTDDEQFIATTLSRLDDAHAARRDRHVQVALARRPLSRRTFVTSLLAAAAVAVVATWGVLSATRGEVPLAFGEVVTPVSASDVLRDGHGRIAAIGPDVVRTDGDAGATRPSVVPSDGEHLLFRSGRLIRIEHWKDGALDGVSVDLDARGFIVAMRQWRAGREIAPALELDADGRPRGP